MNKSIKCKITDKNLLPCYQSAGASGMDLMARAYMYPSDILTGKSERLLNDTPITIQPNSRVLIKTGLCIELPVNTEAQVRPRSGLALKHGITVVNTPGTVDEDYRGEIGVILLNTGDKPFQIAYGDRIAQLVFAEVVKYNLEPSVELSETSRGVGAYGSTGK